MKALLLTSTGLSDPKIKHAFLTLVLKDPSEIKIAFVPTAARTEEELKYVKESRDELVRLGIQPESIKEINLDMVVEWNELQDCDAMYVCGGNTYYLMDQIRKARFDTKMERFLMEGRVYLGVSAGSIVVTPSIAIAGVEPADENDIRLKDMRGLDFVNFEVSPHVPEIVSYKSVEEYSKTTKNKIYAIDNKSAVLAGGGKVSIVGSGVGKEYN